MLSPNYPSDELVEQQGERYYTELIPGKEYQTVLPQKPISESQLNSGLSESDLDMLQTANTSNDSTKLSVWAQDDISPASYMFNYKSSNAVMLWTPYATSRILFNGEEAEVILHQDNTVLHLREKGNFISQFQRNCANDESARVRSFTSETVPFKQVAHQQERTLFINL